MNIAEALKDMEYTVLAGTADTEVSEVVYDSRKVVPGCVFVCLSGTRVDSHQFAGEAVQKAPVFW